jgi:hypothetical protein
VDSLGTLTNPIGSFFDKVKVGLYRQRVSGLSAEEIFSKPQVTGMDRLKVRIPDRLAHAAWHVFVTGHQVGIVPPERVP